MKALKHPLTWFLAAVVVTVMATFTLLAAFEHRGSGDDPDVSRKSPSPLPKSSSLPTPSDEFPERPDKVNEYSRGGVKAFITYYYQLINYGRASGEWRPVQKVTADSCKRCRDFWSEHPSRMNNNLSIRFENDLLITKFGENGSKIVVQVSSDRNIDNIMRKGRESWFDYYTLKYRENEWKVVALEIDRAG